MDYFARIQARLAGEAPLLRPRTASWYTDPVEPAPALHEAADASPASRGVTETGAPSRPDTGRPAPHTASALAETEPGSETETAPPHRSRRPANRAPQRQGAHTGHDVTDDAPLLPPAGAAPRVVAETRGVSDVGPPDREQRPATPALPSVAGESAPVLRRSQTPLLEGAGTLRAHARPRPIDVEPAQPGIRSHGHVPEHRPEAVREPIAAAIRAVSLPPEAPRPLLTAVGPPPALLLPVPAARRTPDVRERSRETAAEQDAPVIEVTIGRVDVRAVAGPAARPPAASGPKPMSLAEYLRRQAEAGA